jgi:RNA polymerase sigma factor (sigma-70 family)
MAILLVRHGETSANASRVVQLPDAPLSERGLAQAERLAERLARVGVAAIVSSDHARALVTAERVRAALDVLPAEQRRAIQLAYFEGKTYRRVAEVLGIPEGTAKSRLRLGLRRIAAALEAEGAEW